MNPNRILALMTMSLCSFMLLSGCGSGLNEVTGKVTLDGKAVAGLEIRFEPKDPEIGTTAIGYTKADGSYVLHYPGDKTGAPAGEYKVTISGGEGDVEGGPPLRVSSKYNSQSQITETVKSGQNTFNYEVTSK